MSRVRTAHDRAFAPSGLRAIECDMRVLAWLVVQKFVLLIPLDRIRRDLAERGIPIAMGTLVSLIERTRPDLLAPVDGVHWKSLLAGRWMATDRAGIAVFQYEPDEAIESLLPRLRAFRGTPARTRRRGRRLPRCNVQRGGARKTARTTW